MRQYQRDNFISAIPVLFYLFIFSFFFKDKKKTSERNVVVAPHPFQYHGIGRKSGRLGVWRHYYCYCYYYYRHGGRQQQRRRRRRRRRQQRRRRHKS